MTAEGEAAPAAAGSRIPGATHPVRQLLPEPGETTIAEQLAGLELNDLAPPERPYLVLNFAATLDGRDPGRPGRSSCGLARGPQARQHHLDQGNAPPGRDHDPQC